MNGPIWNPNISLPIVLYASFFLTIATLAFFGESAIVLRRLVLGRAPFARYPLLILPLGMSILTFVVATYGWQTYADSRYLAGFVGAHLSFSAWNAIRLQMGNLTTAAVLGLTQSALVIILFTVTLVLERKLLPRINQRPLWTVVRRQRVV